VALTQVVEHHLPTYVSLALVWLKVGVKTCMKFEKMKVHHIEKTTKHTSCSIQIKKKAAARGQLRGPWESAAAHTQFFFFFSKPLQGYQVDTTSVLQTTIKGWWWLSKKTTTLWGYSGRRSWFLRITYICPDEQKVSPIEVQGNLTNSIVWNCHIYKASRLWRAINKVE